VASVASAVLVLCVFRDQLAAWAGPGTRLDFVERALDARGAPGAVVQRRARRADLVVEQSAGERRARVVASARHG